MDEAACANMAPEIFFPVTELRETGQRRRLRTNYEPARRICNNCVEKDLCLEYALRWNVKFGMWGGTTPRERSMIRQDRRRDVSD